VTHELSEMSSAIGAQRGALTETGGNETTKLIEFVLLDSTPKINNIH
jgi:hypothetical protein